MNGLTRNSARLLKTVNHKPHATQNDHHDQLPTPPASNTTRSEDANKTLKKLQRDEDDPYRSPDSSDGEDEQPVVRREAVSQKASGFLRPTATDGNDEAKPQTRARFQKPGASAPSSSSKRKSDSGSGSESDGFIFSQSTPAKRPRTNGVGLVNIHTSQVKSNGRHVVYTKRKESAVPPRKGLQQPKRLSQSLKPTVEKPKFQLSKFVEERPSEKTFQLTRESDDVDARAEHLSSPPLSSPLSSVASLEEVDMRVFDQSKPDPLLIDCTICGSKVSKLLRQEFEDRYTNGKALNYKWQGYFCHYHKVDAARNEAADRGYPEVDWPRLDNKLKRHHVHLLDVLEGRRTSDYRIRLEKRLASRKARSTSALVRNKDDSKHDDFSPGYYGPRGERVMTEHITHHLGDQLRELSVSDPLIKASGLAGGVSGFVQAVLVPELAVALVKEDMGVDGRRAAEILGESSEIGELLNGEQREIVGENGERS